ncbi:Peroxiredoxin-4, partial [Galemys pyrenaicus]
KIRLIITETPEHKTQGCCIKEERRHVTGADIDQVSAAAGCEPDTTGHGQTDMEHDAVMKLSTLHSCDTGRAPSAASCGLRGLTSDPRSNASPGLQRLCRGQTLQDTEHQAAEELADKDLVAICPTTNMDHRSRLRGRIPGTQARTPRAPLPLYVEQEAREGEEWEQREVPRQRTPVYGPPENEEMTDSVMGKDTLSLPRQKGSGFIFFLFCPEETAPPLPAAPTPFPGRGRRLLLLPLLLLLLRAGALRGWEADEKPRSREEECHFYAGGQVYPGEASRVSVADHSLHLSKAKISKPAPYWEGTAVINGEFKELKLTDYRGKYLVFFFYPLDFTFVCPTEIIAFGDRIEEFRSINAEVVACSVDSQFTHLAWSVSYTCIYRGNNGFLLKFGQTTLTMINTPRKQGGLGSLKIPLLSDLTHQISKDYGVYLEDSGHTLRGLFIIDDKGVLRQITLNDLPVGRSVDETLRLVQAFQYTDKHGEVCPAGWKPGSE